jgi:hypothetical protein
VLRLRNHERRADAHDARGLAEDDFDPAGIFLAGDLFRACGRLDLAEAYDASFGFRDDLLRENDDVAVLELDRARDQLGEIVALLDLRQAGNRDDAELVSQGSP